MAMWNDYNDAKQNPNLMPKGTLAKVRLTIRPADSMIPARAGPAAMPPAAAPVRSISTASSTSWRGSMPSGKSGR